MKRSDFFKSLFGIALIPVANQFVTTEVKAVTPIPKEVKHLQPSKSGGGGSDMVVSGWIPNKRDFTVNGKEVTKVELIDSKTFVVTWNQDIIPCEITYMK